MDCYLDVVRLVEVQVLRLLSDLPVLQVFHYLVLLMSEAAQEHHLHSTELELLLEYSLQLEQHRLERLLF